MPKPETLVIKRVRTALEAREPHIIMEKTNNPYIGGILDLTFEAWRFYGVAEVKHRPLKVAAGETVDLTSTIKQVSDLQLARFKRHLENEIPCFLLAGFDGPNARNRSYAITEPEPLHPSVDPNSLISPHLITNKLLWFDFEVRALTVDEVVDWIIDWRNSYRLAPL